MLAGQSCPQQHCVVSRLNPRICVEHCEIRGESFNDASWECGLHLINGHHSVLSNLHIIGHTGAQSSLVTGSVYRWVATMLFLPVWFIALGLH